MTFCLFCSNEFVDYFMQIRSEKTDEKDEFLRNIVDTDRMKAEAEAKLEESKNEQINPLTGIRTDAKLKVHIIDANELPEGKMYRVRCVQEKSAAETNDRVGSEPIWNEAIVFNIHDPSSRLVV